MKKKYILLLVFFIFNTYAYSASSGGSNDGSSIKINNFKKGSNLIKQAKKYEKKGKSEKAKKSFSKALKYLLLANKKKPNQPDTLNYLGFASRKIGNFENAEKYYLEGLSIEPNHFGINEYLGELYVNTGRLDKAKERLKVLQNCNCEEFKELNNAINSGSSKY
ncbi:tetratricopeptide repeat protein [Pelagibacteraceae bacterium]|jgi:tetratricopeptide (TPR) repeat protein|nr:tetratricopeptide repeat protein [Candidatus Pelagibacter sp.]MDC1485387.1 tetratricopeptide repeat protein [Pelagibacteraceae bacterium]